MAKKVLFVVAYEDFQPIEYRVPKKIVEDAGIGIITASDKPGIAKAKDGSLAPVDIILDHVVPTDYQGIFFIGGPGALEHLDNNRSYNILQEAHAQGILIGAICISTRILAHAGVLKLKNATGWDGDGQLTQIYNEHDVYYVQQPVVYDQHIITATGPSAADEFGQAIVNALSKQ
jgi:protease I